MNRVLRLDEDELVACVSCGLCLPHCPTYRVTGFEAASPRGRITAMRAVELDGAPLDATFERYMEECIQCRGCEAACPSGGAVRASHGGYPRRAQRERSVQHPSAAPDRRVARVPGRAAAPPAAAGVDLAARRRPTAAPGAAPVRAAALSTPAPFGEPLVADPPATADAYLFTGCVMDAWQRDVHRAALRVMRAAGANPALAGPGGDCCGALHVHAGRSDEARALARRVIASMPGDAPVVVDSAGCGAAMKDYGRLLGTAEAAAFTARVRDFSEWVAERGVPPLRAHRPGGGRPGPVPPPARPEGGSARTDGARDRRTSCARPTTTASAAAPAASTTRCSPRSHARCATARSARSVPRRRAAPCSWRRANPGCAIHLAAAGLDVAHPAELLAAALADGGPPDPFSARSTPDTGVQRAKNQSAGHG